MSTRQLGRRKFIVESAASAAAMTVAAKSNVIGRSMPHDTSKDALLRFGIIGIGNRANQLIPAMMQVPNIKISAICDVNIEQLERGRHRLLGHPVRQYIDYHDLLQDSEVNAVLVNTPNMYHKDMIIDSMKHGHFVVCEKPIATSWDECREIHQAESDFAIKPSVMYTLQLRHASRYKKLKEVLSSGKIGKPQYVLLPEYRGDWARNAWQYKRPDTGQLVNWRFDYVASGGTLNEKMCHYFDIIHWMIDSEPVSVFADGGINHYQDERDTWDHASVHIKYNNGAKALTSLCMYAPFRLEIQIIGENGSLFLCHGGDAILHQRKNSRHIEKIGFPDEVDHSQQGIETATVNMFKEYVRCVLEKENPVLNFGVASEASKTGWLAEISAKEKRVVQWDELSSIV